MQITKDFLSELDGLVSDAASGKPFYAFLFYDLPHTATMPADKAVHFKPSWTFPDYTKLNNPVWPGLPAWSARSPARWRRWLPGSKR